MRKFRFADTPENRKKKRQIDFYSDLKEDRLKKVYNMNIQTMRYDKETKTLYADKLPYMRLLFVKNIMVHNNQTKTSKLFTFDSRNDEYYIYKSEDDIFLYVK
jgi:hypothetical protein